ncbi:porin family protein [Aurantibacter sp.]|uniref:type IX secretion/gliding motility protein PorT/SprT n=1 Tax=Aurantibacter sp. TaxID=2807103 RepID=UPI0035C7E067
MKKITILLSLFLVCQIANAQMFSKEKIQHKVNVDKKLLSWGYYLGYNSLDFKFDYKTLAKDITTAKSGGFNVGLLGNLRITEHIDLRTEPGLVITNRVLLFDESYFSSIPFDDRKPSDLDRELKATYVYLPLSLKFSTTRVNNLRPFVQIGVAAAINLSSNEKNPDDNSNGTFRTKSNMSFYELGLGIDFYFQWFKFSPTIKGVFALNDEVVRDKDVNSPWTGNIEQMQTRGIFINFVIQ